MYTLHVHYNEVYAVILFDLLIFVGGTVSKKYFTTGSKLFMHPTSYENYFTELRYIGHGNR